MRTFFTSLVIFIGFSLKAQTVLDFKKKSNANAAPRTAMLNLLRTEVKKEINQDVVFIVNHFLVSGNYAWLEAKAQPKNGGKLIFPKDYRAGFYDCCHVQSLFVKNSKGAWQIAASGTFSTDLWFECIGKEYPKANPKIFSEAAYCER
ncbi:MAG: hypothetical protein FJX99_07010 [Bacteroidetes bacterium]|nr:hypothetical protein [Bacteroidota bacterium]